MTETTRGYVDQVSRGCHPRTNPCTVGCEVGRPFDSRRHCRRCWRYAHEAEFRAGWGGDASGVTAVGPPLPAAGPSGPRPNAVAPRATTPLPVCGYEGPVVEHCTSCRTPDHRHVRDCSHPDNPTETCTRDHPNAAVWRCSACPHHTARPPVAARPDAGLPPLLVTEIGPHGLARTRDRGAFNGGHVRYQGRPLLAYRAGWSGSVVHVAELDESWRVRRSVRLDLKHPECVAGCEDPRPFEHAGRLYVAFVGVWRRGGAIATSQLYALLRDDLTVETVFRPDLPGRQWPKEKNWGFFSRGGELYAVYSVHPRHVVLRLDGDRAEKVADEPYPWGWSGGFLRGGAPPVLVGDRFYNWTHGRLHHDGTSTYSVGLYTFAADPPFRPLAAVERPLLWANAAEAATTDRGNLAVVFPCGASLEDGRWTVTAGWNDNRLKRLVWDAAEVQLLLGALQTPPPWFRLRPDTSDRWVYDEVVGGNGYGLTTPAVKGRAVLDVGGHVGTFAFAVLARGAVAVHCYEADPGNAAVLQENAGHMPGVEVFPVPVRGACGELLRLKPLYDEWNRGGREVVPGQGLPQAVGIGEAVRRCAAADPGGRVAVLKLDCERSEWSIFAGLAADPAAAAVIDRIVGEWHPPGEMREVRAALEPLGFVVVGRPERDGRGVFTATRSYSLTEK